MVPARDDDDGSAVGSEEGWGWGCVPVRSAVGDGVSLFFGSCCGTEKGGG